MAYVTKEDGIRDFNNHDALGYFKYIDKMIVNSDFTLTRVPKDPKSPGPLDLNSTWKMVPAYVNGYVDAYNLKYHSITPSSYQVTESAKNNYPATTKTADEMIKEALLEANKFAVSDNTGINGKFPAVVDPVSGSITTPDQAAKNIQTQIDNAQAKSNFMYWAIGIIIAIVGIWWFKRKKRR
jgi:hypothetical protein